MTNIPDRALRRWDRLGTIDPTDVFDAIDEGVLVQTASGRIVAVNEAASRILGLPLDLLEGGDRTVLEGPILRPDGTPLPPDEMPGRQAIRTGRPQIGVVFGLANRGGAVMWVEINCRPLIEDGVPVAVVSSLRDVTAKRRVEAALAHQAGHDVVTGLPNRRLLTDRLDAALASGSQVGVIFFDVDHFKLVNDSLGHPAGDGILDEVGQRLRAGARAGDTVSRFGGDEFVVVCDPAGDVDDVLEVAHRLAALVDAPFEVDRGERSVTVSAGVAISNPASTAADLLREADTALNRAKELGRDRIELFTEALEARFTRQVALETELRRALERAELQVVYQPVLDIGREVAVGCEALLRWHHPELGPISPAEFIPIAERTGTITPIGDWVIRQAVGQIRRWSLDVVTPPGFWVSVNVSAVQLARGDLVERVADALEAADVDPSCLHLEITEGVLMDDVHSSIAQLGALRELGVSIDVDDFGTGYSSLAYLKRLPITTLKIDRSFVDGLGTDPQDTSIVRAIISLGHALDLDLVAEGVETDAQLAELRELGCTRAQGYRWLPPRLPDDVVTWLRGAAPADPA